MKNLILSLMILIMGSNLFAQDTVQIRKVTTLSEKVETFLGEIKLTSPEPQVVSVQETVEDSTVFNYKDLDSIWVIQHVYSHPQKSQLKAISPGVFPAMPGHILIFETEPIFEYVKIEPLVDEFDEIENLSRDLATIVADPQHAAKYLSELEAVSFDGDLQSVKIRIGQARQNASRGGVNGQWYKFFQPLDIEISKATTVEEYEMMWRAVIRGLKSHLSSTSNSNQTLQIASPLPIVYSNEPMKPPVLIKPNCEQGCLVPLR